jgi:hypothetical protein
MFPLYIVCDMFDVVRVATSAKGAELELRRAQAHR